MQCDFEYLSLLILLFILCGNATLPSTLYWVQLTSSSSSFDASVKALYDSGKVWRKHVILVIDAVFIVTYTLSYWSRLGNLPSLRYVTLVPALLDSAETAIYVFALRRKTLGTWFMPFRILNLFKSLATFYVLGILTAVQSFGQSTCSLRPRKLA